MKYLILVLLSIQPHFSHSNEVTLNENEKNESVQEIDKTAVKAVKCALKFSRKRIKSFTRKWNQAEKLHSQEKMIALAKITALYLHQARIYKDQPAYLQNAYNSCLETSRQLPSRNWWKEELKTQRIESLGRDLFDEFGQDYDIEILELLEAWFDRSVSEYSFAPAESDFFYDQPLEVYHKLISLSQDSPDCSSAGLRVQIPNSFLLTALTGSEAGMVMGLMFPLGYAGEISMKNCTVNFRKYLSFNLGLGLGAAYGFSPSIDAFRQEYDPLIENYSKRYSIENIGPERFNIDLETYYYGHAIVGPMFSGERGIDPQSDDIMGYGLGLDLGYIGIARVPVLIIPLRYDEEVLIRTFLYSD